MECSKEFWEWMKKDNGYFKEWFQGFGKNGRIMLFGHMFRYLKMRCTTGYIFRHTKIQYEFEDYYNHLEIKIIELDNQERAKQC